MSARTDEIERRMMELRRVHRDATSESARVAILRDHAHLERRLRDVQEFERRHHPSEWDTPHGYSNQITYQEYREHALFDGPRARMIAKPPPVVRSLEPVALAEIKDALETGTEARILTFVGGSGG